MKKFSQLSIGALALFGASSLMITDEADSYATLGFSLGTGQMGTMGGGRSWHGIAHDVREINTAFLEHPAFGDHPADATATLGPVPGVLDERCAIIEGLQTVADGLLQAQQILLDRLAIGLLWHKRS